MTNPIVCWPNVHRYYGDNPDLLGKYRQIRERGNCPFCYPHIENKFLCTTSWWNVIYNQYPYKCTSAHLLLLPKRHVIAVADLKSEEWADMVVVLRGAEAKEPLLSKGYGLALRSGEAGGAILYHLHFHLILPEVGSEGAIPVNFGIG